MGFRLRAFALHLGVSACVLSFVLLILYLGWYRWPGWYLVKAQHVVLIAALVDVCVGPALTFVVANPGKARRVLARDIAVIGAVQLIALLYGASTLWLARPLYYTFSADRLEVVQASDINSTEAARGRRENPALAPHWYSLPRWVWAPLPDDPKLQMSIVNSAIFGGDDVVDMPRYFRPWDEGLNQLRTQLLEVGSLKALSPEDRKRATALMAARGFATRERNCIVMFGDATRLVAVFDLRTLRLLALLDVS